VAFVFRQYAIKAKEILIIFAIGLQFFAVVFADFRFLDELAKALLAILEY
jgi:hypothetical protein